MTHKIVLERGENCSLFIWWMWRESIIAFILQFGVLNLQFYFVEKLIVGRLSPLLVVVVHFAARPSLWWVRWIDRLWLIFVILLHLLVDIDLGDFFLLDTQICAQRMLTILVAFSLVWDVAGLPILHDCAMPLNLCHQRHKICTCQLSQYNSLLVCLILDRCIR